MYTTMAQEMINEYLSKIQNIICKDTWSWEYCASPRALIRMQRCTIGGYMYTTWRYLTPTKGHKLYPKTLMCVVVYAMCYRKLYIMRQMDDLLYRNRVLEKQGKRRMEEIRELRALWNKASSGIDDCKRDRARIKESF